MGIQSKAALLPPDRAWWVKALPTHRRLTHLLTEELMHLQAHREHRDACEIRTFLGRFRAVTRDGNVLAAELGVRRAKPHMAVVYSHIPGVTAISWFPVLIVPMTDRIGRIMAETGVVERFPRKPEPARDAWGEPERNRPPVLPKVVIRMVGG